MADVVDPRIQPRDMVVFEVGAGTHTHYVAVDRNSVPATGNTMLTRCLTANPPNCQAQVIRIANTIREDRSTLTRYLQYLQTGNVRPYTLKGDGTTSGFHELRTALDLYGFGEKMQDPDFQDNVIDAIIARYNTDEDKKDFISEAYVRYTYRHTAPDSLLRKLMVDIHFWSDAVEACFEQPGKPGLEDFERDVMRKLIDRSDDRSKALVDDLLLALFKGGDTTSAKQKLLAKNRGESAGKIPADVSCCDYHLHATGALCGNRKRKREASDNGSD